MQRFLLFLLTFYIFSKPSLAFNLLITADEVSNTLSFVEANSFKTISYMKLGPIQRFALFPALKAPTQINVHGLALSPDKKTIAVTSNISNSVALYKADDLSKMISYENVGLSPHVSTYTPDSRELWVATRGTSQVEIIDVKTGKVTSKLPTKECPSFFAFHRDQPWVYISYTCSTSLDVFNYKTKKLLNSLTLNGHFSPLISLTPDQKELWVIRKDTGEVARVSTEKFSVIEYIPSGLYPQHVLFGEVDGKTVGLITSGADNALKAYRYEAGAVQPASLIFSVKIPGLPHGLAVSPDRKTAYVASEHGDKVYAVSLEKRVVTGTAQVGNSPQSLIYVQDFKFGDYKTFTRRFTEETSSKSYDLISKNPVMKNQRASVSVRKNNFEFFIDFKIFGEIPEDSRFNFYITHSSVKYEKIKDKDKALIGIATCFIDKNFCMANSSLPFTDTLFRLFSHPKSKIYVTNSENKVVFSD